MRTAIAMVLVLGAGCVETKVPVDDDVSAAFAADSKADLPTNTKFLGDLDHGLKMPVSYTKTPRYRSVGFWGVSGDDVNISVASTDGGDAVAWLLDFNGKVIAWNDDASSDTYDAAIHTKLTASNGHYFIYFRDYDLKRHHFTITKTGGHPTDSAGDAERAWDAANGDNGPDAFLIDRTALPASARATYDKYAAKYAASAWKIPSYYVVGGAAEEINWVDIYDLGGTFIVHGASGDGGWQMSFWGEPRQPWDPSGSL
ncbi:MAG TPA: hypothetical protein VL463_28105 [Kofleriaceae bacterium]|nr:hypothetical protein [Kofleriaceae bacterium]